MFNFEIEDALAVSIGHCKFLVTPRIVPALNIMLDGGTVCVDMRLGEVRSEDAILFDRLVEFNVLEDTSFGYGIHPDEKEQNKRVVQELIDAIQKAGE